MSVSLNGNVSNYLSIANSLGLAQNSAQTWCGWFKPANTNAAKMAFAALLADGYTSSTAYSFSASAEILPWGGSYSYGTSIRTYSADTWYFIYWRGDGGLFNLRAGAAASGLSATTDFNDADHSLTQQSATTSYASIELGRKGADGYPWNGELCCVRVWGAQLSTTELLAEALSASAVRSSNLIANWRLADNSDLTDTANSYVLTANGTVSNGSTEPSDIGSASIVPHAMANYRMRSA